MTCDKSPQKIKHIFDEISPYYDEMNNFISWGTHLFVKYFSVRMLAVKKYSDILDLCCGSGDFTKIISKLYPQSKIIGLDNSVEMIKHAKIKNPHKPFVIGDCTDLPFGNEEFDIITIGFGLRNIYDRTKAIQEGFRVLKKDGQFLHLDFGKHNIFSRIFDSLVALIVKLLGKNEQAYLYLSDSKKEYPEPNELIKEFEKEGFKLVKRKDFLLGVVSAQVYKK